MHPCERLARGSFVCLLLQEMLHRRFSTLTNLFKDGGELKDKREVRTYAILVLTLTQ